MSITEQKFQQLQTLLRSYGSCAVAYSGGVDSVFLAKVSHDVLGDRSLAVIADSPSLPRAELAEALDLGLRFEFPVEVIRTAEFDNPAYASNPENRCYFCKAELFTHLVPLAKERGFSVIAYGENASDVGDYRPGAQAAAENQIRAPLKEVGLTKAEIRELSAQLGLPTADKPQMACLSSRVPHGEAVTSRKVRMIEEAEAALKQLGFIQLRVRHHEAPGPILVPVGAEKPALARIEIDASEFPKLRDPGLLQKMQAAVKQVGYLHVTLDLAPYRNLERKTEKQAGG